MIYAVYAVLIEPTGEIILKGESLETITQHIRVNPTRIIVYRSGRGRVWRPTDRRVDIRRDDHEPVNSTQVERDNPTPTSVKEEIDRNYRKEIYGQDDYDPNNDPWP